MKYSSALITELKEYETDPAYMFSYEVEEELREVAKWHCWIGIRTHVLPEYVFAYALDLLKEAGEL